MEYRICNLHATNRLSSDPQISPRPAILLPCLPQILSRTGFSLNSFYHISDYKAYYEAHVLRRSSSSSSWSVNSHVAKNKMSNPLDTIKKSEDNKDSIDERDGEDEEEKEEIKMESSVSERSNNNDNEDPENESDGGGGGGDDSKSTDNSYPSGDYISSTKPLTPFSYFGLDKNDSMTSSLLSGWVLGAYTAMLGTLSTATTPFETIQVPTTQSDSESESGHSSYTEKSTENNSMVGIHKDYSCCGLCNISSVTRCALRKHMLNCHQRQATASPGMSDLLTTTTTTTTTTNNNSRCQAKTHVGTTCHHHHHHHSMVAKQEASSSKKRALTLQRVRYEREEYKCTECSYACTIEKAFQRHLRAHAKGTLAATATETRVSCAVCGTDRSSEVDLSRHMRRHRDDRYFCCDICVFRTVQLKKLIQHRRMHTGEKPHLCPHCAYRSARRDNLRSHVRRVHKKENLYCDTFSPQGCMLIGPSLQEEEASSITTSESVTIITDAAATTTHVQHPSSSTSHVVQ